MWRFIFFTFFVGVLWALTVGVSAQDHTPRLTSPQLIATTRFEFSFVFTPSSELHTDIRQSNSQSDENDPLHSCYNNDIENTLPDVAGSYSIYARLIHPGGTLVISTDGSNYDTVASLYPYVDVGQPLGTAVACSDDADINNPSANRTSYFAAPIPAGVYLLVVSRYDQTEASSALALNLTVAYTPDSAVATNDAIENARVITVNTPVTQTDVHHTTYDTLETGLDADCELSNSVWYKFVPPVAGGYIFTTQGSLLSLGASQTIVNNGLALYEGGYDPDTSAWYLNFEGCMIGSTNSVTTPLLFLTPNKTYYIRLGYPGVINILPNSRYRMRVVPTVVPLNTNAGFDDGLVGWKTSKFTSGDGLDTGWVEISSGAEKKTLSQNQTNYTNKKLYKWVKGATVIVNAQYDYTGTPSGKFMITITYSDGTPKTVVNAPFSTSSNGQMAVPAILASKNVKAVKLTAVVNPNSDFTIRINAFSAYYYRDGAPARDILPLPLP